MMRLDFFRIFVVILLIVIAIGIFSEEKPSGFYTEQVGRFCTAFTGGFSGTMYNLNDSYARGSPAFRLALICVVLIAVVGIISVLSGRRDDP